MLKRRIEMRDVVDVDVFTLEEVNERTVFWPATGRYKTLFHRHYDMKSHVIKRWSEIWYSKVLNGDFVEYNRVIKQFSMSDRARAYPTNNDGNTIGKQIIRRAIIFAKKEDDIALIKLATV